MSNKVPSIEDIKKRIREKNEKKTQFKSTVSKDFYPFWNMEVNQTATVRLLPDLNSDNPLPYYLDYFNHKLSIDGKDWTVPCPKSWDITADCPICERSQKYYRENDKQRGSYYWRNKNAFVRFLVLEDPLDVKDEEGKSVDYVGRTCTSTFGNKILIAIENQLADFEPDEPLPWLIDNGYDFHIKKIKGAGNYADYSFSSFAKRPSPIPEEYRDNIELIDFRDLLPENPGLEKVQHYLDAHDGVVEFKYGGNSRSSDNQSGDTDGDDDGEDRGRERASESRVEPPKSEPKKTASREAVLDSDGDDDRDMIRDILSRANS